MGDLAAEIEAEMLNTHILLIRQTSHLDVLSFSEMLLRTLKKKYFNDKAPLFELLAI